MIGEARCGVKRLAGAQPVRYAVCMAQLGEIRLVTEDGTETVLALPLSLLRALGVEQGGKIYACPLEGGEVRISRIPPEVRSQIEIGCEFMERYRATFEALAKS